MAGVRELFQAADWKTEKHVPVIEAPDTAKKGEFFRVTVSVGKQIAHPNATEHHIRWVVLFFLADGEKFPCQIGRAELASHGESTQGPNTSTIFTNSEAVFSMKSDKSGAMMASSYCNIHGLWESSKRIEIK